jgi:hypothetical protein
MAIKKGQLFELFYEDRKFEVNIKLNRKHSFLHFVCSHFLERMRGCLGHRMVKKLELFLGQLQRHFCYFTMGILKA